MLRRNAFLLLILAFFLVVEPSVFPLKLWVSAGPFSGSRKPLVTMVANSTIFKSIELSLDQYMTDIQNEGFSVQIVQTNQLSEKTPPAIRAYLAEAFPRGLVGAFLVGDIPEAWIRVNTTILPTDMYYRDLDGTWIDTNGDGVYEEHIGNTAPEIWVGRLKASPILGNETSLINNYFVKNHRYRNGLRVLPWWRALAYLDDDGVDWAQDVNSSLSQVDTDVTLVTDRATTTAEDYRRRIADPFGYQWVYLMCHGSYDYHVFMIDNELTGGTVYPYQYRDIDPRVLFYMLFVCSGARYTEKEYLAGTAVFTKTYGLVAIGSTDTIYSISFRKFFADLGERKSIGDAFQEWFLEQNNWQNQLKEGEDYQYLYYGLTIIGDPTLRLDIRPNVKLHDISVTSSKATILNESNKYSAIITATISNLGDFNESFDVAIFQDKYKLASSPVFLSAKNYITINLTIPDPFRVAIVNKTRTHLTLVSSPIPEEFNLADDVNDVFLENAVILFPELSLPNPWIALVIFLSIGLIIAYTIFKAISSDSAIPSFVARGKQYFARKFSALTRRNRKSG